MKVKVVRVFADKFNLSKVYNPGEVLDFEETRAHDIVVRGLGEFVKETAPIKKESIKEPAPIKEEVHETPAVVESMVEKPAEEVVEEKPKKEYPKTAEKNLKRGRPKKTE